MALIVSMAKMALAKMAELAVLGCLKTSLAKDKINFGPSLLDFRSSTTIKTLDHSPSG